MSICVEKGRITRYFHKKGFGYINPKKGKDIFFHISDVTNYSRDMKMEGKDVAYDSYKTKRGKRAFNVIII